METKNRVLKFQRPDPTKEQLVSTLVGALSLKDNETGGHAERVVSYSLKLGREFGLSELELEDLRFGAMLHDIGKIGVPDAILKKPAALTEDEWVVMRFHPVMGCNLISGVSFLHAASRVVLQHHEKFDGTGYPYSLRGEGIDILARIFVVADAFDAITSDRVYRRGASYEAAQGELLKFSGSQFDPEVVETFLRIPESVWSEVRDLHSGEADFAQIRRAA